MSDVNSQGQGQPPSDVDFVALSPADDRPLRDRGYPRPGRLRHHLSRPRHPARPRSRHQGISAGRRSPCAKTAYIGAAALDQRSPKTSTWGRERFVDEGRTLATLHGAPAIVRSLRLPRGQRHRLHRHGAGARRDARAKRISARALLAGRDRRASCGRCSTGWSRCARSASCIATSSRPTSCSVPRPIRP